MATYLSRVVDDELRRRMAAIGAVVIEGPKACGKTVTASRAARTIIRFDEDDAARMAAQLAPERLFEHTAPILFDEWQIEPKIWNRVRRQVDARREHGLYILTGSATPNDDVTRHSGAGRFGVIHMRPMSLYESGHSSGAVSLASLFDGEQPTADGSGLGFAELVAQIVIGGWPSLVDATEEEARDWLADYLTQIVEVDIPALGSRRDPRNIRRLLAALARGVGQATKATELAKDVGGADGPIAPQTLKAYTDALRRLHLIEDAPPWQPHMRSKARLRSAEVNYFVDPSLGPASLGVGSAELMAEPRALGFHFEALVMRDLRVYAQPLRGRVDSWRDSNGNEVDAVISLPDGRWAAIEVNLNPAAVDDAARSLRRFVDSVDTDHHGPPALIGVITGSGYAGRRSDGVHVIPIGTLGP